MLLQRHHALSLTASLLLGSHLGYAYDLDLDSEGGFHDVFMACLSARMHIA